MRMAVTYRYRYHVHSQAACAIGRLLGAYLAPLWGI
jgi:hypothetical protein